ncbi:MAG: hypothetical protein AB7K24_01635 [Gemmataceae bacterium]
MYCVFVNHSEEHVVASDDDAERLCGGLAELPAFTVNVIGPGGRTGPSLDVIVSSERGLVSFLDMERGVKLASRNPDCPERDIVRLRNEAYPELQLDQIEAERRDLISPRQAVAIMRHFLLTGEPIDLVPWPPDDWEDRPIDVEPGLPPGEEVPF